MIVRYFAGIPGTANDVMAEFRVTKLNRNGGDLSVEFKPVRGWTLTDDTIRLVDVGWVPFRWLWPAAWAALIIVSLVTALQQYLAGHYLGLTAPLALFFLSFVWIPGVVSRAQYGSLYHPRGFIQPENEEEAALFASCRTLDLAEYAAMWVQQFQVCKPLAEQQPEQENE